MHPDVHPDKIERKSKRPREVLREANETIDSWFEESKRSGTNLAPAERNFLKDVAQRDWIWTCRTEAREAIGNIPSAMKDAQRKAKLACLQRLRAGLADLALLTKSCAPNADRIGEHRPWINKDDIQKVLTLEDLEKVVSFSIRVFGQQYADAFLKELSDFYASKNEEIVIQRRVPEGYRSGRS